jgi:hypothetical protein
MKIFLSLFCLAFSFLFSDIQVIPVSRSSQSETASVQIVFPEKGFINNEDLVWVQVRVRGYSLGNSSQLTRASEIANSSLGQSLHVIVDNFPYFARVETKIAPYDEDHDYYEDMYKFKIPFSLSQGRHTLRIFACRSFGESLKSENVFDSTYFYVQNKRENDQTDLTKPYITYNEPSGYLKLKEKEPVLLDFYVSNCELSQDGYKVRLYIDGNIERTLTQWSPYYIYGLKTGSHTLRLELINKDGMRVLGSFNDTQRNFLIE